VKKQTVLPLIAAVAVVVALILTFIFGASLWDIAGNRAFQTLGGWLKAPMEGFTFLGDEQFYLLLLPLVYWCLNKSLGADMGVLLVLSVFANVALKSLFKQARPFWEDSSVKLSDTTSFSTPSGHSQNSSTLFGYIAWFLAGGEGSRPSRLYRLWTILIALLIACVALSRVYLGVHFFGDILWGVAAGLVMLALYAGLKPRLLPWLRRRSVGTHVILAVIAAAFMIGLTVINLSIPIGTAQTYGSIYTDAVRATLDDAATLAGLVSGLWIGLALETRYVRFSVSGAVWQRAIRYVVGLVGLFAIWMGLRIIFPQEPMVLGLALRVIRYGLAMLWAIAGWPWLFVRIGLGRGPHAGD